MGIRQIIAAVIVGGSLGRMTLFAAESRSPVMGNESPVGTYALQLIQEGGTTILYRINTRTGKVWEYTERIILQAADHGDPKVIPHLEKMIRDARSEMKSVYTQPYWTPLTEEMPDRFTVH